MDRVIVYPGQVPLETDILNTNKYAMVGLGRLAGAVLGSVASGAGLVEGLKVTSTVTPGLSVLVSPGSMYTSLAVDATDYSTVSADTSNSIPKQGILLSSFTLDCTSLKPASGYRIVYITASLADDNDGTTVLPYYNSSNTAVALNGPGGASTLQARRRYTKLTISTRLGNSVTTGTAPLPTLSGNEVALATLLLRSTTTTISSSADSSTNAYIISGRVTTTLDTTSIASGTYGLVDGNGASTDPHVYPPYASLNSANIFTSSSLFNAIVTFGAGANSSQDASTVNAIPRLSQFQLLKGSNGWAVKIPVWDTDPNPDVKRDFTVCWGSATSSATAGSSTTVTFLTVCGSSFSTGVTPRVIVTPATTSPSSIQAWQGTATATEFLLRCSAASTACDFVAFGY